MLISYEILNEADISHMKYLTRMFREIFIFIIDQLSILIELIHRIQERHQLRTRISLQGVSIAKVVRRWRSVSKSTSME